MKSLKIVSVFLFVLCLTYSISLAVPCASPVCDITGPLTAATTYRLDWDAPLIPNSAKILYENTVEIHINEYNDGKNFKIFTISSMTGDSRTYQLVYCTDYQGQEEVCHDEGPLKTVTFEYPDVTITDSNVNTGEITLSWDTTSGHGIRLYESENGGLNYRFYGNYSGSGTTINKGSGAYKEFSYIAKYCNSGSCGNNSGAADKVVFNANSSGPLAGIRRVIMIFVDGLGSFHRTGWPITKVSDLPDGTAGKAENRYIKNYMPALWGRMTNAGHDGWDTAYTFRMIGRQNTSTGNNFASILMGGLTGDDPHGTGVGTTAYAVGNGLDTGNPQAREGERNLPSIMYAYKQAYGKGIGPWGNGYVFGAGLYHTTLVPFSHDKLGNEVTNLLSGKNSFHDMICNSPRTDGLVCKSSGGSNGATRDHNGGGDGVDKRVLVYCRS